MLYMGMAFTLFGVMRLITAVTGTVRLDRQVAQLNYYQQTLQYRAICAESTRNGLGFVASFIALLVGGVLIHASLT